MTRHSMVGTVLQIKNFKDYIELYLKDKEDENGQPLKIVHELVSDRWEVALTLSEKGFQQVSFVNSVATTKVGFISSLQHRPHYRSCPFVCLSVLYGLLTQKQKDR